MQGTDILVRRIYDGIDDQEGHNVDGIKQANLRVGADQDNNWKAARYKEGSGTNTLVFEYQVHSVDRDDDGIDVEMPGSLNIKASGTQIDYQSGPGAPAPELTEESGHKVDGSLHDDTAPSITAVTFDDSPGPGDDSTNEEGDWIVVAVMFDENVDVLQGAISRPPQIQLVICDALRTARYGVPPGSPEGLSQPEAPTPCCSLATWCRRGTLTLMGSP